MQRASLRKNSILSRNPAGMSWMLSGCAIRRAISGRKLNFIDRNHWALMAVGLAEHRSAECNPKCISNRCGSISVIYGRDVASAYKDKEINPVGHFTIPAKSLPHLKFFEHFLSGAFLSNNISEWVSTGFYANPSHDKHTNTQPKSKNAVDFSPASISTSPKMS